VNIFVTSGSAFSCAKVLDDKRVVKMVLETAQMLSTAITEHGGEGFYKPTHVNHPCSRWVRETRGNYWWTVLHFHALLSEYSRRYLRTHKCSNHFLAAVRGGLFIPEGSRTPFVDCSGQSEGDVFDNYWACLRHKWANDKTPPTRYRERITHAASL